MLKYLLAILNFLVDYGNIIINDVLSEVMVVKEKLRYHWIGIIAASVTFIGSIVLIVSILRAALLSGLLVFIASLIFALFVATILALAWDRRHLPRTIIAIVMAVITLFVQCMGVYYVSVGRSTLEKITTPAIDYNEIGVYVRKDDAAKTLSDVSKYKFGILDVQDRKSTDYAIEEISKKLSKDITYDEFSGIEDLMDALLKDKSVDCIVINKGMLELLEETENHSQDAKKVKEIYSVRIENKNTADSTPSTDDEIFTVFISGIDSRGGLSRRSRSDVNILATVNAKTGQILLVSTPRDYYVPLSISNGVPDKLTHAGIYGIDVSCDTIEMIYDIEIDYYFRVNFSGFEKIINALGGIKVNSEVAFNDGKHTFKKGENYLNGEEALAFARNRYSVKGGDRQRGKNQMAVIKGVIDKAISPAILLNYKDTLDGMAGSFETNMPYDTLAKLIRNQINVGTKWNVVSYSVNGKGASRKVYSLSGKAYVMIPDETTIEHAKELIKQVKDGGVPKP